MTSQGSCSIGAARGRIWKWPWHPAHSPHFLSWGEEGAARAPGQLISSASAACGSSLASEGAGRPQGRRDSGVAPPPWNWKWVVGVKGKRSGSVLASQLQQICSVPEFKPGPVYKRPSCPANASYARPLPTPPAPEGPRRGWASPPPPQVWGSRGAGGVDVLTSHLLLGDLSGFPPWNVSCG